MNLPTYPQSKRMKLKRLGNLSTLLSNVTLKSKHTSSQIASVNQYYRITKYSFRVDPYTYLFSYCSF